MLELYKKDMQLYAKVLLNLKLQIQYQNKLFDNKKEETMLLLPDEVMYILSRNGNIKLWNGQKFVKLNLGQFYDVMKNKNYNVVEFVEPKKEEVKIQSQPKVEMKKEEPKVEQPKKEEAKPQQQEQPKKEEAKQQPQQPKKDHQNDNKKQRHNNNNNNQNKQQGGDK